MSQRNLTPDCLFCLEIDFLNLLLLGVISDPFQTQGQILFVRSVFATAVLSKEKWNCCSRLFNQFGSACVPSAGVRIHKGFDINVLRKEARCRWLKPSEVYYILQNHERFPITPEPPKKPLSGSLFLYNRRVNQYFREDGHAWRRKKDGRTVAEAHERLKVGNIDALSCYYAHGEQNPCFQRRCFWMLEPGYEHIVLVQYREVAEGRYYSASLSNGPAESISAISFPHAIYGNQYHGSTSGNSEGSESRQSYSNLSSVTEVSSCSANKEYNKDSGTLLGIPELDQTTIMGAPELGQTTDNSNSKNKSGLNLALKKIAEQLSLGDDDDDYIYLNQVQPVDFVTNIEAADRQGNHTSSQLGKVSETAREDGHREYSELTKNFKRQKIVKDAWRIFSNEDYSDTRNQDSDSLARVEEQHYTLCKDVNAWLALVKQCQKGGLYHTCMQQAPPQLLGRDDIKQRIAEKMLGSNGESNSTVICIVAESGLGKTSLLRVLHNDQQLLDAFDKRICIQMSDKFDKLMLFRSIIEYAMRDHCSITNLSFLEEMVKEELVDKKFLLFLDDADIEDQHFWTSALEIINAGMKGSAVVIATRSTTVADFTAGALHSYYLDPLSEESNLMLLQQYACMGQDIHSNPDLVAIAKRFIARFGANPLKLKALGVFLFHSDIIPLDEGRFEGDTVPCLRLCHDILPIYLKQCLVFCSLFPKGYIFDKHHMVLLWLSRGFIMPAEGRELEDIGVGYFHELLCRSFFQYSPFHSEKDNKFVMHELIYNVVVSISHDKYFKSEDPLSHIPKNICHLSLVSSQFQTVQLASRTEELKDLQTFLVVQPEWQQRKISFPTLNFVCLNDFFLKFRSLETLDLSYTDIEELPSSIVGLRNLRYLSLNNTSIRALPSELCGLSNLQTLEAKDCHFLTELPEDTRRLLKLRHLNVGKKLGYVRMPRGVGQLTELRTVPVFHVGGGLSHCSINELGNLYSLRGCLLVAGLENVRNGSETLEANLNYKQHLRDLTLQWHDGSVDIDDNNEEGAENVAEQVLESLQPHANLQELAIRRYQGNEFPSWMQGSSSLPSLVSLTLDSCCNCTRFPAIAQLPSLKFLSVRKMYEVQRLSSDTHGAIKFPSLELLNLWEMYGLEELFEVSEGDCPRLRKICISRCPFLKRLPCIPSVVELVLHCCDQLPDIPELASLASLKIEGFHDVRSLSLPPQLPALRKLDIRGCSELSSVHGLSVLTAVERLKIAGCPKLDLSKN